MHRHFLLTTAIVALAAVLLLVGTMRETSESDQMVDLNTEPVMLQGGLFGSARQVDRPAKTIFHGFLSARNRQVAWGGMPVLKYYSPMIWVTPGNLPQISGARVWEKTF